MTGEYIEQADRDEQAQPPVNWELTPEESEKQDLIDENYQFSSYLSYHNDYVLLVHTPITLPPDPTSVEQALGQWDKVEWGVAIDDEIANFRSREIVRKAAQEGKALKTKIVLKYT
jgi:hypothetical protein